jgi:CyaY protein
VAGAGSGILSGPFWPHAASAASEARAKATRSARIIERIMNESEFHGAVDAVLARVESSLEGEDRLDVDLESGILTLTCADGSKVIVNRQTPNREIWVAARSGGFHFAWRDGEWRDTRSKEELFASLARILASQGGVEARWK